MKRIFLILLLLIMLNLSGCSDRDVTRYNFLYEGENDEWKASMPFKGSLIFYTDKDGTLQYDKNIQSNLVVTYIGEEEKFSRLKKLEISYKSLASKGTLSVEYDESELKEKSFRFSSAAGDAILDKDTVTTITISMDGVTQTLELIDK